MTYSQTERDRERKKTSQIDTINSCSTEAQKISYALYLS